MARIGKAGGERGERHVAARAGARGVQIGVRGQRRGGPWAVECLNGAGDCVAALDIALLDQ